MASNLHDKINSYTLEKGVEFSSAVTTTPPQTGSITANTILLANTPSITFDSTVGPLNGSGSWRFTMTGTDTGPVSAPRATFNTGAQYLPFQDGDWSVGFWWKLNSQMTTVTASRLSNVWNVSPVGTTNPGVTISYAGSANANAGKLLINIGSYTNIPISGVISLNTWYFIAVTRINTTSTNNIKAYINGVNTWTGSQAILSGTSVTTQMKFGDTNSYANYSWSFSNFYYTTSSAIDSTAISEIWIAGATVPSTRTVKYFDGTTWQTSSAQKVFNGTAWVDWNAKRFDGSSWVNV